jgi:hypothetical protein
MSFCRVRVVCVAVAVMLVGSVARAQQPDASGPKCRTIHADLVEDGGTVGCKPEHPDCFLGVVDGNHGVRGTTYFRSDSAAAGPSTSPSFISYSGVFEYSLQGGTIVARETGVFDRTIGGPSSGVLTAHHQILSATGDWAGATGHFFVSGFRTGQHVETQLTGVVCVPR